MKTIKTSTGRGLHGKEPTGIAMKKVVMDVEGIERSLSRIAYEIIERNKGTDNLIIIGIRKGGVSLAERLCKKISDIEKTEVMFGTLDITLYRDDVLTTGKRPEIENTYIPFPLDQKRVVIVDDVLFTGRTIRAAMDALMDFGRPKQIQLAVLIDRGHRELPIRADFIGETLPSSLWENISVNLVADNPDLSGDEVVIEVG
ncbi:MAG TPA: bifunctional pyr operon transcriptional regulator/uracil phosphoribosyltransferase PyrR [Syntrophales bacterium]|nr:bifunctional pyr operon transcriptional regulator/uracil phosphoribosyltransferase PyrR [Syntrophales bacterium]HPQ45314.1 bifunctional pyr operon transcriptional regulator/uracil phosphoribosyltransferase PyrR [Syntrophales bacterium]